MESKCEALYQPVAISLSHVTSAKIMSLAHIKS